MSNKYNEKKKPKLSSVASFFKTYNWYNLSLFWNQIYKRRLAKTLKNFEIKQDHMSFEYKGNRIKFYFDSVIQMNNTLGMIKEQFLDNQYGWLGVKGEEVIDIGANVGDTAIYFAAEGAKHVYALEPYPYSYDLAKKNVSESNLVNKVTLLNVACSDKKSTIKILEGHKNLGDSDIKISETGKEIEVTTLDDLVKEYKTKGALLKMDCEGCEYSIILNASADTLRNFKKIMIEYHYGYKNLYDKLSESGFSVEYTKPKTSINGEAEKKKMTVGLLKARRLEKPLEANSQ